MLSKKLRTLAESFSRDNPDFPIIRALADEAEALEKSAASTAMDASLATVAASDAAEACAVQPWMRAAAREITREYIHFKGRPCGEPYYSDLAAIIRKHFTAQPHPQALELAMQIQHEANLHKKYREYDKFDTTTLTDEIRVLVGLLCEYSKAVAALATPPADAAKGAR